MSAPTPEQLDRVNRWIRREAAARSLEEIHVWVRERQTQLIASARPLTPTQLRTPPADGEWSPLEALRHVVEWNAQVSEDVLHTCLTGERPGNPVPSLDLDVDGLVAREQATLDSLWAHVSEADPDAFLDVTWEHPFFGQLNWREWFLFLGVHCSDHAGQITAASSHDA